MPHSHQRSALVLLEPGLAVVAIAQQHREALARGIERYHEVGAETVVDEFLNARWPGYRESLDRVLHAEGLVLPGATHFLHVEDPSFSHDLAKALADFFARRPITA